MIIVVGNLKEALPGTKSAIAVLPEVFSSSVARSSALSPSSSNMAMVVWRDSVLHRMVPAMALKQLEIDLAGRHGPVTSLAMYDVMCSYECLESDKLHEEAMRISDCNCEEVSTQPSSNYFKIRGDFCRENSGRQL